MIVRLIRVCLISSTTVAMLCLAGCGGGGSNSDAPPSSAPSTSVMAEPELVLAGPASVLDAQGLGLSVSTSRLDIRLTEGQTVATSMILRSVGTQEFAAGVRPRIFDSANLLLSGNYVLDPFDARSLSTELVIRAAPLPGRHTGTLTVRICSDYYCDSYVGPEITVPYTVTVEAFPTQLTTLSRLTNEVPWFSYRANNGRTGYVPLTLDSRRFQARWLWRGLPHPTDVGLTSNITGMAWADGSLLVSSQQFFPYISHLTRLNEHDGRQVWSHASDSDSIGGPTVSGDRVWGHRDLESTQHELTSWSLSDGQVQTQASFQGQHPRYFGPAVANGDIVAMGGLTGGLMRADGNNGQFIWQNPFISRNINWTTPAVDAQRAYIYTPSNCSGCGGAGLYGYDLATGEQSLFIADAVGSNRWLNDDMNGSVVLSGSQSASVIAKSVDARGPHRLLRFDLSTQSLSWSQAGTYLSAPVVAGGVIYAARSDPFGVEARRESDGALLWTWVEPGPMNALTEDASTMREAPAGAMALTDSHLFVSSTQRVYAIDLNTKTSVWRYPRGGDLLISPTGVLYVASGRFGRSAGQVAAISLN